MAVGADGAAGHGARPAADHLAVAVHVLRAAVPRAPLRQARIVEQVRAAEAVTARGQPRRGVQPLYPLLGSHVAAVKAPVLAPVAVVSGLVAEVGGDGVDARRVAEGRVLEQAILRPVASSVLRPRAVAVHEEVFLIVSVSDGAGRGERVAPAGSGRSEGWVAHHGPGAGVEQRHVGGGGGQAALPATEQYGASPPGYHS